MNGFDMFSPQVVDGENPTLTAGGSGIGEKDAPAGFHPAGRPSELRPGRLVAALAGCGRHET
ncbi:MAG TPA: hypothetical protein VHA76_12605, partial [Solirubrobacterales bacterium]|nr:hypothetical protein [Solirubrobacterales bacterium]